MLPSPTNAIVRSRSEPHRSISVWQSASAWQGCSSSVSALTMRRPGRGGGEALEPLLRERADDDAEDPALEVARDVLDRLAAAERDVGRRLDHVAAELADGDRERRPRAQRRLVEQQRDVPAGQRRRVRPAGVARGLHRRRQRRDRSPARPASGRERTGTATAATGRRPRDTHVRYSALIFTYSALRSHVHIRAAPGLPVPEVDAERDVRCPAGARTPAAPARRTGGRRRTARRRRSAPARARGRSPRRRARRPRRAVPSSDRRRAPRSSPAASWRSPAPPAWPRRRSRPPVTSMVTSLVAPSPPRTIPIASGSHTRRSASTNRSSSPPR